MGLYGLKRTYTNSIKHCDQLLALKNPNKLPLNGQYFQVQNISKQFFIQLKQVKEQIIHLQVMQRVWIGEKTLKFVKIWNSHVISDIFMQLFYEKTHKHCKKTP